MLDKFKTMVLEWLTSGLPDDEEEDEEISEEEAHQYLIERMKKEQEAKDNWVPPTRYCVHVGGDAIWVQNYKPNPVFGIDVIWQQKVGGEMKTVAATILESSFTIVDYETQWTPKTFEHVRHQSMDTMLQKMQEMANREVELTENVKAGAEASLSAYG